MKYLSLLILQFTVLLFSCNRPGIIHDRMNVYFQQNRDSQYFYEDSIIHSEGITEKWANSILFAAEEPRLSRYKGEGKFIRLTYLRSFENPLIIRLNIFPDISYINIKELQRLSEKKYRLIVDTIVSIDQKQEAAIFSKINKTDFWTTSFKINKERKKDGTNWFLECRISDKYKVIQRWDDGSLLSEDLLIYLPPLLQTADHIVSFQSSR